MLTLFTWGYWGWGGSTRSTRKLVQAVDVAEKKRGQKPPFFVDIRLQRSVRAKGFIGDARRCIRTCCGSRTLPTYA
jgi:hypothetical protein